MKISVLLLLSSFFVNNITAQLDTLKKFPNGNILLGNKATNELVTPSGIVISKWSNFFQLLTLAGKDYDVIQLKPTAGKIKYGLFDNVQGIVELDPIYDAISPLGVGGNIRMFLGDSLGVYNTKSKIKIAPGILKSFGLHINPTLLLGYKKQKAYTYDMDLNLLDSIPDVLYADGVLNQYLNPYLVLKLKNGIGLLSKENKFYTQPEWKHFNEMKGNILLVTTDSGISLYDLGTKRTIKPYSFEKYTVGTNTLQCFLYQKGKWTILSREGKVVLEIVADEIIEGGSGTEGYYFRKGEYWGLMNRKGQIVQKPIWKTILSTNSETFKGEINGGKIKWYKWVYEMVANIKLLKSIREIKAPDKGGPEDEGIMILTSEGQKNN